MNRRRERESPYHLERVSKQNEEGSEDNTRANSLPRFGNTRNDLQMQNSEQSNAQTFREDPSKLQMSNRTD